MELWVTFLFFFLPPICFNTYVQSLLGDSDLGITKI